MQVHTIHWIELTELATWKAIIEESFQKPILLFKHSTRCGISHMALERLEEQWKSNPLPVKPVFLDLISHRVVSQQIAADMGVLHQSPQVLVLWQGECVFTTSHNAISVPIIARAVDQLSVNS